MAISFFLQSTLKEAPERRVCSPVKWVEGFFLFRSARWFFKHPFGGLVCTKNFLALLFTNGYESLIAFNKLTSQCFIKVLHKVLILFSLSFTPDLIEIERWPRSYHCGLAWKVDESRRQSSLIPTRQYLMHAASSGTSSLRRFKDNVRINLITFRTNFTRTPFRMISHRIWTLLVRWR